MEKEILERMDQLIDFVQSKSPMIWEAFCKQQILEGINSIIFLALTLMLYSGGLYILKTKPKWALDNDQFNVGGTLITILSVFLSFVAIGLFLVKGLTQLLNPEYHALMSLKP